MLVLRNERVVDDRAISALRIELGRCLTQIGRIPEAGSNLSALADDLLLLHQLGEQNVERSERHDHQDREDGDRDHTALFESGNEAVWTWSGGGCCLHALSSF